MKEHMSNDTDDVQIKTFDLSKDDAIEHLIGVAKSHGEDEDPDHEVGDLQDLIRCMWSKMAEAPRRAFLEDKAVGQILEAAMCGEDLPYIHGTWTHLFGSGRTETAVRLVYDLREERIVAMQLLGLPGPSFCTASQAEILDVEDSLKNANSEALSDPSEYGLARAYVLPTWAWADGAAEQFDAQPARERPRG